MKSENPILCLRHPYHSKWKWKLFEPKYLLGKSDIVGKNKDSVEMAPSHASPVGNSNRCVH